MRGMLAEMRDRSLHQSHALQALAPSGTMPQARLSLHPRGLILEGKGVHAELRPCVKVNGGLLEMTAGQAQIEDEVLKVRFDDVGELTLVVEGDLLTIRFEAEARCALEGMGLVGLVEVAGAYAHLSNGFQSWSQSGVLALGPAATGEALEQALRMQGDLEMIRGGSELSYWYTCIGGGASSLFAGALTANTFRTYLTVSRAEAGLSFRMMCGGTGEAISMVRGQSVQSECLCLDGGSDTEALLERYGRRLPSRRELAPRDAQAGWMSWYELWDQGLSEQAALQNARLLKPVFEPLLLGSQTPALRVIIDDGWQEAWGDWLPNEKFPTGLDGLGKSLQEQGLEKGVWLAPFLAHEKSRIVTAHPEWFVEDAAYLHAKCGRMRVLDVTHPEAAVHLQTCIKRIVSWGYDYLKVDFLFAGTFEGRRHEPVTGMQAYQRGMQLIREAAGEKTFILGVGAPVVGTFGYVDAYRVGFDIAIEALGTLKVGPSWVFVVNQARSLAARYFLGHATLLDVDPLLLRSPSQAEVKVAMFVCALAGGSFFLSDDLRKLPSDRLGWVESELLSLALGARSGRPENLFVSDPPAALANPVSEHLLRQNRQQLPSVWRFSDGRRVAFNFGDESRMVETVSLAPHAATCLP